jgi:hypothetical protein
MPEDIAGGSYVPDMPDGMTPFTPYDYEDEMGAFLDKLAREGARPDGPSGAPPPMPRPTLPEERGPGGVGWERDPHTPYLDPPDMPQWIKPDPSWRQEPIENRSMQGLEKNFIPGVRHTPQNAAILKILEMRNAGQGKGFDEEGYERMPIESSPMADQVGMKELRNPTLTIDPARDRYLGMVQMADRMEIPGTIPDMRVIPNKTPSAEEMIEAIFAGRREGTEPGDRVRVLPQPSLPPGKTLNEMIEEGAFPLEEGSILDDDD